jgi:hypothetical protein
VARDSYLVPSRTSLILNGREYRLLPPRTRDTQVADVSANIEGNAAAEEDAIEASENDNLNDQNQ